MNFIYPLSRYIKITQVYWSGHLGVDFGWNDGAYCNQPIVAIEDGTVVGCADGYGNTYPNKRIYGNYVNISHGNGWFSMYGHLLKGITVTKGQTVRKGQVIGYMGNTGYSNGQHLHFELRKGANAKANSIDPLDYLYVEDKSIYVNPASKEYGRIRYRQVSPVDPVARDITRALNTEDYQNYTWYNIDKDKWCAGVSGVTFYKASAPQTYKILFPYVSEGDRDDLLDMAEEKQLRVIVEKN